MALVTAAGDHFIGQGAGKCGKVSEGIRPYIMQNDAPGVEAAGLTPFGAVFRMRLASTLRASSLSLFRREDGTPRAPCRVIGCRGLSGEPLPVVRS